MIDPQVLHVAVRWLHVVAMALAFGGAALVFVLALRATRSGVGEAALLQIAAGYEWIFWAAAGVLVMTGIGNLGAFGSTLPAPNSAWGATFIAKLALVLSLVVLSLPRTLALGTLGAPPGRSLVVALRRIYGATTAAFAVIVGFAIWLAHG